MFTRHTTLSGHAGTVRTIAAAESGNVLVSAGDDFALCVWDSSTWSNRHIIRDMDPGSRQAIMILDVSACGKYVATGAPDFTTKVYSTETGNRLARLHPSIRDRYNSAEQICFSHTGDYLACAKGRTIDYFCVGTFAKAGELKGHTTKVQLLGFSPNGKTLISGGGRQIKLWDMKTVSEPRTLAKHAKLLGSLAVSPAGEFFATGGEDAQIFLWSLPDGREIGHYDCHTDRVFNLAISPDGLVVASLEMLGHLHLWNARTCKTMARLTVHRGRQAFVPNHSLLVFFGEKAETLILNQTSGEVVQRIPPTQAGAVASDGRWLACADGNDVAIWLNKTTESAGCRT
jgi:WD40 repeat protein